jgi:hypothetical protein
LARQFRAAPSHATGKRSIEARPEPRQFKALLDVRQPVGTALIDKLTELKGQLGQARLLKIKARPAAASFGR